MNATGIPCPLARPRLRSAKIHEMLSGIRPNASRGVPGRLSVLGLAILTGACQRNDAPALPAEVGYTPFNELQKSLPVDSSLPMDERVDPSRVPDVEYVPTPQPVVDLMLEVANLRQSDVLYDLGCGDGRIVVTAAKRYRVRAYGFDIDPERVAEARENVRKYHVGHLVTIQQRDIFTLDLSPADVVTLYLLPELNVKLIPQLRKLRPGSRIVSHDFEMDPIEPLKVLQIDHDGEPHVVYLWNGPV